jgi:hypothetical protein
LELLWNDWRDHVTHNHDRDRIDDLIRDSNRYFNRRKRDKRAILRTIGSPFQNRNHELVSLSGRVLCAGQGRTGIVLILLRHTGLMPASA